MGQRTNTAKLNWLVYNVGSYGIIKHSLSDRACVAWFSFQLGQCKETESHDRAGNTVYSVCVTNGKDMAIQRQIWSTFVTVLWFRKTEIQNRAGILVFVRVLWVTISKFTDNFGTVSSYLHFFFHLCYYIESTSAEVLEHAYLCFPVSLFFKFLNKSIRAIIERLHEILQSPRGKKETRLSFIPKKINTDFVFCVCVCVCVCLNERNISLVAICAVI